MFFVAIEGIDASGKATQAALLKEWFGNRREVNRKEKLKVLSASFPDYNSITGRAIKAHLKREWRVEFASGEEKIDRERRAFDPLVFQSLQTSNRHECLPEEAWTNPPNTVLVADRYHASALVYGSLDGLQLELLDKMNQSLPMPDRYILLDVPVEKSVERRPERRDRYETDIEYLRAVQAQYKLLFASRPGWVTIDGTRSVREVHEQIVAIVDDCFRSEPIP
jgi:dTMP kinase